MHIALCIDNNYTMQCGVLITSILFSNKDENIKFHILSDKISAENKKKLENICRNSGYCIVFYEIQFDLIRNAPIGKNDYLSVAAYYRLFIPILLPADIDKVLYLDCDIVVIDSLRELWETDINLYSTAVGIDAGCNDIRHFNRLEIPESHDYFNSGVLLINLKHWRDNQVFKKFLDFINNHAEQCKQHDQDVLNKLLLGTVIYFSPRYNYLDLFFTDVKTLLIKKKLHKDIINSASKITVMHFAGGEKPWHIECSHPYKTLWDSFCKKTEWAYFSKTYKYSGRQFFKKQFRRILEKMHLLEPHIKYRNQNQYVQ